MPTFQLKSLMEQLAVSQEANLINLRTQKQESWFHNAGKKSGSRAASESRAGSLESGENGLLIDTFIAHLSSI